MKTSFPLAARTWAAILFTVCLSTACDKEEPSVKPAVPDTAAVKENLWIRCFRPVYVATIRFNARRVANNCYFSPGNICVRFIKIWDFRCWLSPDYFERIKPNPCLSCPEDIFKYLPGELIPDFRRELGPELALDEKESAIFFPITTGVIGLQFGAENDFITKGGFTLKEDLVLSEEEQKGLGVSGKVIPAGAYPVVYNEKHNTFNALMAVR